MNKTTKQNRHRYKEKMCAFPATMPDITLNVFLTLNKMYQFSEKK